MIKPLKIWEVCKFCYTAMFAPSSKRSLTACINRTTAVRDLLEKLKKSKALRGTEPGRYHGSEYIEILLLNSKASLSHLSHSVFFFLLHNLVYFRLIYSPHRCVNTSYFNTHSATAVNEMATEETEMASSSQKIGTTASLWITTLSLLSAAHKRSVSSSAPGSRTLLNFHGAKPSKSKLFALQEKSVSHA